jgi:mannose-6-phosphate isomerase-like protein (cupin superfamily)
MVQAAKAAKTQSKKTTKTTKTTPKQRRPVILSPGGGRAYEMGRLRAVFKADEDETNGMYAISEWWLEPNTKGPGAHSHEDDDVFYVLEGTMSICVGGKWTDAPKGTFVIAPGGVKHDFENRSKKRAGMLNLSIPGGFEEHMPGIASWFRARPDAESDVKKRA